MTHNNANLQPYTMQLLLKIFFLISINNMLIFTNHTQAEDTIRVKTAPIEAIAIYPERSAPAISISLNNSILSAEIDARINEFLAQVGDIIDTENTLVQLDCSDYTLALRQSKAKLTAIESRLELANQRMQRTRKLILKKSVATEILDEHESEYAVLNAELEQMQIEILIQARNVSHCAVRSPFRALVIEQISAVGEFVQEGTPILRVLDIDKMEVSAQILNRDVQQIQNSNALFFEHETTLYPVNLRTIVQSINRNTRDREVRLNFLQRNALPGSTGKLIWTDNRAHIPHNLLVRRNNVFGVFIVANNMAQFHPMPKAQAGRASIIDLPAASQIVIEGHFALTDKAAVDIVH